MLQTDAFCVKGEREFLPFASPPLPSPFLAGERRKEGKGSEREEMSREEGEGERREVGTRPPIG